MLAAIMAMAVVLDSHPSPDPSTLVDQLGSSRYAARVAAEGELARMGRSALPALRAAKRSKDAEIRARSVALLAKIEDSMLLQPTPVSLDFRDVPLADAIEAINRRAGLGLTLTPEDKASLAGRRLSLRSDEPLPFWKAIDALCSAGKVHPNQDDLPGTTRLDGSFPLQDGLVTGQGPASDEGPFRVRLASIHAQSEILLDNPRQGPDGQKIPAEASPDGSRSTTPRASREFYLQFVAVAEPHLTITRSGAIRVTSAVDDRGQSLTDPGALGSFQQASGYFGMSPSSLFRFRVDLNYPQSQARQIRILRGKIPVVVAMRKPDPLVVPLAGSRGNLHHNEEVALTLLDHRPALGNQPATIQVAIRPLGAPSEPIDPGQGGPLAYRPDSPQRQLEVLDARGRVLPWFPSGTFYDGEESRLTLTIPSQGAPGVPCTLRYHGILRAKAEIGFEFRDIPIP